MNTIGQIIETKSILDNFKNEKGCGTSAKVCEYLSCQKGEVYVVFDDLDNIQQGELVKIKEDVCRNLSLAAFTKEDDSPSRQGDYWLNKGYDGNAIIYLNDYKYIMRIK